MMLNEHVNELGTSNTVYTYLIKNNVTDLWVCGTLLQGGRA